MVSRSDEEINDYFERRSPELRAYMQKFLPEEYAKFQESIDACNKANARALQNEIT
jgi:hypothetical protein